MFKAVRSRGPGGQNVNKVSSAALLSWDYRHSRLLSEEEKNRLAVKAANHISGEGLLQLRSDEFRDLERNKARCLEKLSRIVKAALFIPKKRKATKPTRSSQARRVESKTKRGEVKKLRRKVWD
ncbi:MAG TPA: alternative ribosome rescue aminoacyl-tRNA hydrolase ArfB [Bdellovibrionales bacterium]|nr:alternative ribosome rescue aminoacyl-tRNA hydrolase ArfB [Bdellovibrionales bacterium]